MSNRLLPFVAIVLLAMLSISVASALAVVPSGTGVPKATAGKPVTLYVSKLGDNSDGSTWEKSFKTIQAAPG